jgi:outer membrane protein TolC
MKLTTKFAQLAGFWAGGPEFGGKRPFFTVALMVLALHAAGAQTVLNMEDAVALVLGQNLGLEREWIGVEAKKKTADGAWAGLVPSVSAGASYSRGMSLTGDFSPPGREKWTLGLPLSVSVTLSPATVTDMKTTRADYEASLVSYEEARRNLELQARKIFCQILLLQANLEMAERNLAGAEARYNEAAARARVGQVSRLDELSAKVDFENLKPAKRNAETQLTNALEGFALLLGLDPGEKITLEGSLEQFVSELTAGQGAELSAENSTGVARQESYTITSLRMGMDVLQIKRRAAWWPYAPSLSVSWNGNLSYNNDAWADNSGSFSIKLSFLLDPFLPRSKARNQIAAMDDNIALQRIKITEALREQDTQVRQSLRLLEQAAENINAASLNLDLARETYTMWEQSYRQGGADLQQMRNAGDSLSRAENQLIQEQYNMLIAALDLQRSLNLPFGLSAIPEQEEF